MFRGEIWYSVSWGTWRQKFIIPGYVVPENSVMENFLSDGKMDGQGKNNICPFLKKWGYNRRKSDKKCRHYPGNNLILCCITIIVLVPLKKANTFPTIYYNITVKQLLMSSSFRTLFSYRKGWEPQNFPFKMYKPLLFQLYILQHYI